MRRMRSGLLFAAAVTLIGLGAPPLAAQVAPSLSGETGLFELRNADMTAPGRFSFSLFFSQWDRVAAPSLINAPGADDPLRYSVGKGGVTVAWGVTSTFELTANTGMRIYSADDRDWNGAINGHERAGRIKHTETDKIRFGAKLLLNPKVDPVKVVLFGGFAIPTQSRSDPDALSTYRADYDFGVSFNYGIATFETSYLLAGDQGEAWDVPNELKFGLGLAFPIIPRTLKVIAEINRVHYDGGFTKPGDFTEALGGARLGLGSTGFTASGAIRVNIDRWVKYGTNPSNIGGLVQIGWSPQLANGVTASAPAASTPEEPAPAAAPPAETAPSAPGATSTPAPSPRPSVEPPPAPRAETSTTDEVLYDAGKSRLTNIAKAILDGVALRLKNNLAATCTVTGFADPGEKAGKMDHAALAKARSEAAKDYLVKRHGIDAARIHVDARGDAEAGPDATRNRRAVVTVTFP